MKRSYLSNIILLAVLIGLFMLYEQQQTPTHFTRFADNIAPQTIQHIQVTRLDNSEIEILRTADGWQLITPFNAPASESRVALLINLLNQPIQQVGTPSGEEIFDDFGFSADQPLTLNLNEHAFLFGDLETLSEQRYVRYQQHLYLFEDEITALMQASPSSFIHNRLFLANEQIEKLILPILNPDQTLDTNDTVFINTSEGFNLLTSWQSAHALQVVPYITLPEDITATIVVQFSNQEQLALPIALSDTGLAIFHPIRQLRYQFPATVAESLFPKKP